MYGFSQRQITRSSKASRPDFAENPPRRPCSLPWRSLCQGCGTRNPGGSYGFVGCSMNLLDIFDAWETYKHTHIYIYIQTVRMIMRVYALYVSWGHNNASKWVHITGV